MIDLTIWDTLNIRIPYNDLDLQKFNFKNNEIFVYSYTVLGIHVNLSIRQLNSIDTLLIYDLLRKNSNELKNGYALSWTASSYTDNTSEFIVYRSILKLLEDHFSDLNWDYLRLDASTQDSLKLNAAIIQRLTFQPGVENIVHNKLTFAVTKF